MSLSLILLRLAPSIKIYEDLSKGDTLPLGSFDEVKRAVDDCFPKVEWAPPNYGVYISETHSIEFMIPEEENVTSLHLTVRGPGDPQSIILKLAGAQDWVIVDVDGCELIDPRRPQSWR